MAYTNLLFIFADEQRYDTLAAYGNSRIQTPNLDKLARESTVFERAYVTQPVCTPSRSSLVTGLYPHSNGCTANNVPLRDDVPCLPEMLPPGKFATGYHGKWHLGDEIFSQHGFAEWISIEDGYCGYYREGRDQNARSSYHHFLTDSGFAPANGSQFGRDEATRLPEEFGKPAFLAREASRFIREHRADPFVLFVNFLEPHMPFFGPRDDQHDPAQVALPPNFDSLLSEQYHLRPRLIARAIEHLGLGGELFETEEDWRRLIARYWGLCSLVDTHAGAILSTLEECGLLDDTIIVYTSDHGDMMGSHRLIAKCVMFEEAVRVPLMIRLPGQRNGQRVSQPVSQIDLIPTLLELLGQAAPPHLQGRSLMPSLKPEGDVFVEWNVESPGNAGMPHSHLLRGEYPEFLESLANREEALAAVADPIRTIVTSDGWKLNWSSLGMHELFSLRDDPYEMRNLATEPESKSLMDDLAGRIRRWQERTIDPLLGG